MTFSRKFYEEICPFENSCVCISSMHIFYVKILHLVTSIVVGGLGCKGMVEERETLRKVSEANHWFQYLEKEGVSVTLEDIGKQTMPDGSILPLPPILLGSSGNDPKKKTVCIYGHLDVQPAALYCSQIWLGKYDSKSGEADFSTPDKRREFMRLKYEEKKLYVDPREAIKKMKPPGPVAPTSASPSVSQSKATL